MFNAMDQLAVNTIRLLSLDQVEKAGAGHPGAPMGQSPMAHVLWTRHLKANPKNSKWFNRDRFVLSAGHGSPMLYSLLHVAGYDVTMDDVKGFRGFNTRTPGHPEVTHTDGVEATTGPLGQGVANAVGMAMAEAHLSAKYNTQEFDIVDHHTYVLVGDGDLQEGIAQEASSLAGHLQLNKLIMLYDSNDIQLDGETNMAFTENVKDKYIAYGWNYLLVEDGNDLVAIDNAINEAKLSADKPTMIEIKTKIGFGMPNVGTSDAHSDPIGIEGVAHTRKELEWVYENDFYVPEDVYNLYNEKMVQRGQQLEKNWNDQFESYANANPKLAQQLQDSINRKLPEDWKENFPVYEPGDSESTRDTSAKMINAIADKVSDFWGGSADLATSNRTMIKSDGDFQPNAYDERNIWYGVREFAMGGILNGILLHGGTRSYVGTFLVFSDYLRSAIRIAALSELPAIYVFTHDSVVVGFDGATHEPVEHLASYRAMPNIITFRPADANETVAAWEFAMENDNKPVILALSRQGLPVLENSGKLASEGVRKGAYIVSPSKSENQDGVIIATGSEVSLSIKAQEKLSEEGTDVSVVSMPSMELFKTQDSEYQNSVIPKSVSKRLVVEAGSELGWAKYYGDNGDMISIDTFGLTGPGDQVLESFGYTVENVVETFKKL